MTKNVVYVDQYLGVPSVQPAYDFCKVKKSAYEGTFLDDPEMGVTDVVHVGDPHLGVVQRGSPKFGDTRTPSRGVPRGVLHFVNFGFWNLGMFFGDFLCTLVHLMFYNCVTPVLGVVLGGCYADFFPVL